MSTLSLSLSHYVLDTFHMFQLSTWQNFFSPAFFSPFLSPLFRVSSPKPWQQTQHLKTPWKHRLDAGNRISPSLELHKKGIPTLPKTSSLHLKIGHPKRKLIFQPSIFRCENVSFREGIPLASLSRFPAASAPLGGSIPKHPFNRSVTSIGSVPCLMLEKTPHQPPEMMGCPAC